MYEFTPSLLISILNSNELKSIDLTSNVFTLKDSLRTYKDKTGKLVYEKGEIKSGNASLKIKGKAVLPTYLVARNIVLTLIHSGTREKNSSK